MREHPGPISKWRSVEKFVPGDTVIAPVFGSGAMSGGAALLGWSLL
jgi:hypothetical protein